MPKEAGNQTFLLQRDIVMRRDLDLTPLLIFEFAASKPATMQRRRVPTGIYSSNFTHSIFCNTF